MSKVSVGMLSVFNHEINDWVLFKGRLQQWFIANDISEENDKAGVKRSAVLLTSLSENSFKLVSDLAFPADLSTLTYLNLIGLLDGHFKQKKCTFAERHKFHIAVQRSDESNGEWAARVRNLASECGFPTSNLDEMLRDRFVLGLNGTAERDKLFAEPLETLTLLKALQLAENVRCARQRARELSSTTGRSPTREFGSLQLDVHKMATRPGARSAPAPAPAQGPPPPSSNQRRFCSVCGANNHDNRVCRFRYYSCNKCGSKGHLSRVCKRSATQHYLQCCSEDGDDGMLLFNIRVCQGEPLQESVMVDRVVLSFEVDTGSAVTAISDALYYEYFSAYPLQECKKILHSYNGSLISCIGTICLPFSYRGSRQMIEVYVVKGGGPPLIGRDFLEKFNMQICPMNQVKGLDSFEKSFPTLFSDQLGCLKGQEVDLLLKEDAVPIFKKSRPVPFALRTKLEEEISRLMGLGIIEPVSSSDYASPIVPVLRNDGKIRLCADYSATLNKQLVVDKYPLPRVEDLFSKLQGGQQFTKLDLSGAYNQLKLSASSQPLTCVNTHKGLFKFNRLVFGLSSAQAIFQRTIEKILSGIEGMVLQYLDDILITGKSEEEHFKTLQEVLKRLEGAGLVLRKDKCLFFQNSVSYLGFVIDRHGLHKSADKVRSILEAKRPSNTSELKSFLGLVNYYRNFIKNASSILCPLHELLKKNVKWSWGTEHENAFEFIKKELASDNTLAHFNQDAKIILTVDASPFGLGAILSQIEKGIERPICYASRSLNAAEKRYSQIQKEATAIIFGVRKFHQFLYERDTLFVLRTDHKPLLSIFSPNRGVPEVSANRLQRYALFLSAYNYVIEYVPSALYSADFPSRMTPVVGSNQTQSALSKTDDHESEIDIATYVHFIWQANTQPSYRQRRR